MDVTTKFGEDENTQLNRERHVWMYSDIHLWSLIDVRIWWSAHATWNYQLLTNPTLYLGYQHDISSMLCLYDEPQYELLSLALQEKEVIVQALRSVTAGNALWFDS